MKAIDQTQKFSDITNMQDKTQSTRTSQHLVRRKSEKDFSKKRPPTSQPQEKGMVCFIPMAKIDKNPSDIMNQTAPQQRVSRKPSNQSENVFSNETSYRKFSRNSQTNSKKGSCDDFRKIMEPLQCKNEDCKKEKTEMKLKIDRLMAINQHLSRQTQRLNGLLAKINNKIVESSDDLREKTMRVEQLTKHHQQLEEMLAGKDRLIVRLQQTIKTMEKQKPPMSCKARCDDPQTADIIHQLNQKLKYKEIQSYIYKKERSAHQQLDREHKAVLKQNSVLKQRLSYYMKIKTKEQRSCLKDSLSSLSLSMTSACSERFHMPLFDYEGSEKQSSEQINDSHL